MFDSRTTTTPEVTNDTSTDHPPVRVNQREIPQGRGSANEAEVEQGVMIGQRVMRAIGGGSPAAPPEQFAEALGGVPGRSQTGLWRQMQRGYGNNYVGRVIQAKLTVNQPGDSYEQEADRIAAHVMATPQSDRSIQREIGPKKEKEKIQMKPSLQLAPDGNQEAGGNLEGRLNSSKGGGSPLPDDVRSFMEPRFGADFSQVRVHTGRESVQMNQDLNAQAFTHKQDIYFGAGKAPAKDALTAHELTHVVQQCSSAGTLQRQPAIRSTPASRPDSAPGLGPTRTEEVENLIKAGDFQGAIDTLVGYKYMDHEIDLNLLADKKMTYDPNLKASDATTSMPSWDYLSTPEKAEPAKVKVGSSAFSSVSYFYSVIMHEYQHVLWQQTLAHQKQSHLAHSQGDMAPDEVEAGAWELLHATETGVARLPDKVAQIWENLNDAFWKLDPKAQASERQLVVRAFQKAKTFMKGSQLTLVPFSPP